MKLDTLLEAAYDDRFVIVEEWSGDGTKFYRVSKKQVEQLKKLTHVSPKEKSDQECFAEADKILSKDKQLQANVIFDWFNFELKNKDD